MKISLIAAISKNNVKAILFDLDNTLLDRSLTFLNFSKMLINHYFSDLEDLEKQKMIDYIIIADEDGYKDKIQLFKELLDIFPWSSKPDIEELLAYYTAEYVNNAILMEDALEVLLHLKKQYKLGMITNGKTVIQYGKIDQLNLREHFDTIIVSEEAGIKKPHKSIFELAINHLNVRPEECLYIGDHPVNDINGANQAGMKTIWMKVNQPWRDELTVVPFKTITKLKELLELL
jgi:putative hydrolase of the HAD superfamily